MEASDDALVRAFLSGEKEAFRPLYTRYRDRAFFFALGLTFDEPLAEEAVQEAFLAFLRKGRDFVPGGSFRGYLFAAVRSRAIDFLRKAKRDPVLLNGREPSLFESTGRDRTGLNGIDEDGDDRGRAVTRALAALPPEQREVVILKVFDGMTFRGIGRVCGISENTAASRYRYGRDKLKLRLNGIRLNGIRPNGMTNHG